MIHAFNDATSKPHGYLLVNFMRTKSPTLNLAWVDFLLLPIRFLVSKHFQKPWPIPTAYTTVLLMYTLEGVSSVANFITAYEESQ